MAEVIETLDDFQQWFHDAEWLETHNGFERWSNGLGEGSMHESEWFCERCGLLAEDRGESGRCDACDGIGEDLNRMHCWDCNELSKPGALVCEHCGGRNVEELGDAMNDGLPNE